MNRVEIVAEARKWIGTPWQHNANVRGVGCDCAGLLRGVMIGLQLMPEDLHQWPHASRWIEYTSWPDGSLTSACDQFMRRIERSQMQSGDVVVLTIDQLPQHMGILAESKYGSQTIIHAMSDPRYMRVVEQRLMFSRHQRFAGAYAFPGID